MNSKRLAAFPAFLIAAAAISAALVPAALAAPGGATLTIRHQLRGCHSWSLDNGAYRASQSVVLRRGAVLRVTDDDVMPHTLVELSGPAVKVGSGAATGMSAMAMKRMGASLAVTFSKTGVYRFTTKAGEDYRVGVKTVGPDNVLELKVTVR